MKTKTTLATLCAASLLAVMAHADHKDGRDRYVNEYVDVQPHHVFASPTQVNGATILIRDFKNKVIDATVVSKALEPDTAYSIWAAVFNKSKFCAVPYHCTLADLKGDPRIRPSVFWAGGFVADAFGSANASFKIHKGRTKRELFAGGDDGLANLKGSDVHIVLRTHGAAGIAGSLATQVGTAKMACPKEGCANVFASMHPPR